MKKKTWMLLLSALFAGFCVQTPALALSDSDETRVQTMQRDADEDALKRGQKAHAELLAKQFQIPTSDVEKLRSSGQGWGEVTIQLALADKLVKTDPVTYPNMNVALERIGTMRSDGKGWGNISKELGFKLGPVISDVKHSLKDLRAEFKNGKIEKAELKQEARADIDRVQRPERPERPQRPERPERPEKPERNGR